jgi:carbamoyl-phosphate synthase large subunit
MSSTGEVACFGKDIEEAYLKAVFSVGLRLPKKRILVTIGNFFKEAFLPYAKLLADLGYKLYATEGTATYLKTFGIRATVVRKGYEGGRNNTLYIIKQRKVDFVINIRDKENVDGEFSRIKKERSDGYKIRRAAADHNIPLITNFEKAQLFIKALSQKQHSDLVVAPWRVYLRKEVQGRLL